MKKSELKLYDVFYNQNRHLSIVYKMTRTNIHIINYNGSIYSLTHGDNHVNYEEVNISPEGFFNNFPYGKIFKQEVRDDFKKIEKEYYRLKENYELFNGNIIKITRNLLLIL